MGFIDEIKAKAKSCKKTIVLPAVSYTHLPLEIDMHTGDNWYEAK